MSEMVERVAKAQAGKRWDTFDDEHKAAARELARIAIDAMREPTARMERAGDEMEGSAAHSVWLTMIDEALK